MMPTIRVDDDVYDWLQRRAKPFVDTPNSVLRRELKIGTAATPAAHGRAGELNALVQAGLLRADEELIWKRRGVSHRAVVTSGGALELEDGRIFESPSGAARALAGYEVNGWRNWARVRDGVRLASLRDQL
ncbi:restriction system modified-DNA reader domain-containing protein [Paractinoplanes globisporus]|uniref:DUF4357 domain-containing protein n=1 Tax=Paractinoplanes globisporus TaxID=113565 RepID=A0ABW6WE70_9ACTN|nr:DUF4357 domain-containing protein [Actinoplanes globisporus]